jgi:hypothetical protein
MLAARLCSSTESCFSSQYFSHAAWRLRLSANGAGEDFGSGGLMGWHCVQRGKTMSSKQVRANPSRSMAGENPAIHPCSPLSISLLKQWTAVQRPGTRTACKALVAAWWQLLGDLRGRSHQAGTRTVRLKFSKLLFYIMKLAGVAGFEPTYGGSEPGRSPSKIIKLLILRHRRSPQIPSNPPRGHHNGHQTLRRTLEHGRPTRSQQCSMHRRHVGFRTRRSGRGSQ